MSEGISLQQQITLSPISQTSTCYEKKRTSLFQAQAAHFQMDPSIARKCHQSSLDAVPILLVGSKNNRTTIGRGHDASVQIGKADKKVSREHVVIEHKPHLNRFEMTILSPNGALVDHIIFVEGEHVPMIQDTIIEIVGTKLIFHVPQDDDHEKKTQEAETPSKLKVKEEEMVEIQPIKEDLSLLDNEMDIDQEEEKKSLNIIKDTLEMEMEVDNSTIHQLIKTTATTIKKTARNVIKKPITLEDEIIQVLVCTRKSTMTCTDISKRLQGQSIDNISKVLVHSPAIGCVKRLGKTADGSPKEDLYYYKVELDSDVERQKKYSDVGKSARKCTMKDTQYFFKIPPKLPTHRSKITHTSTIITTTTTTATNKKKGSKYGTTSNNSKEEEDGDDDEELRSTSSGDVSDMEVFELFKDV